MVSTNEPGTLFHAPLWRAALRLPMRCPNVKVGTLEQGHHSAKNQVEEAAAKGWSSFQRHLQGYGAAGSCGLF